MRPLQAPYLFNGALSDIINIVSNMDKRHTVAAIGDMDKTISKLENAIKTMRDCQQTVNNAKKFSFESPFIVL